jgi:hypothetical protein
MKESMMVGGTSCHVNLESCDINRLHHATSITPNKMADDISIRQHTVIKFFVKEEIPAAKTPRMLEEMCTEKWQLCGKIKKGL